MSAFQDLLGWKKGMNEVVYHKRHMFPNVQIYELNERQDKVLTYILRKSYKELENRKKRK
jgi:hypothetical protein